MVKAFTSTYIKFFVNKLEANFEDTVDFFIVNFDRSIYKYVQNKKNIRLL